MLICCICLPDAWFSLWSQEVSPKPTPDTKAGLIIVEKYDRYVCWSRKTGLEDE